MARMVLVLVLLAGCGDDDVTCPKIVIDDCAADAGPSRLERELRAFNDCQKRCAAIGRRGDLSASNEFLCLCEDPAPVPFCRDGADRYGRCRP